MFEKKKSSCDIEATLPDVFRLDWILDADSLLIAFGVLVFSLTFDLGAGRPDGMQSADKTASDGDD